MRQPEDFPAVLATTCRLAGCDIPYSIIPLAKARLSLLISVSWAKMLSPWFSFEDLIDCVLLIPRREIRQHSRIKR